MDLLKIQMEEEAAEFADSALPQGTHPRCSKQTNVANVPFAFPSSTRVQQFDPQEGNCWGCMTLRARSVMVLRKERE